jgi:peptidoglycan/LPS O-acetylase OafA/YrhL
MPLLLRIFVASHFEVDQFWVGTKIHKVVIYRLDSIAWGLLAAFIKHCYPNFWYKSRNISFLLGIIISYATLYSTWIPNDFSTKVFFISFQSIGCLLLLPKFDSIKKAPLVLTKIFTHISLISYSMFLLNLALVTEIIRDNFPPQNPYTAWFAYVVYWLAVIIFSTLLYKYYEKPMMDLRNKFR